MTHATLSKDQLDSILHVATEASLAAGRIIAESLSTNTQVIERKANARDLLTLLDPQCEQTIRDIVSKTFPSHAFLGEEDVPPGKEASAAALDAKLNQSCEFLWIVDPIDGT
jgi:myo-inositol-1(or 4)-monophosphatase